LIDSPGNVARPLSSFQDQDCATIADFSPHQEDHMNETLEWMKSEREREMREYRERLKGIILIQFLGIIQNSQVLKAENPDEDHLFSQCFFLMNVEGNGWQAMHASVRQPYGEDFGENPIEMATPSGGACPEPFPYDQFTDLVDAYYRSKIGPSGSVISAPGMGNVFAENVIFSPSDVVSLSLPTSDHPSGGWQLDPSRKWHGKAAPRPSGLGMTPVGHAPDPG
jgi:hypothetical protein